MLPEVLFFRNENLRHCDTTKATVLQGHNGYLSHFSFASCVLASKLDHNIYYFCIAAAIATAITINEHAMPYSTNRFPPAGATINTSVTITRLVALVFLSGLLYTYIITLISNNWSIFSHC